MKKRACCFAGHATIVDAEKVSTNVRKSIIELIVNSSVNTFYSGGKGQFDMICARSVFDVKKEYPHIESYLVLDRLPTNPNIAFENFLEIFNGTIYPDLEKVPPRFAILKRNEWLVDNSDFLIAYVKHSWGGAYKTLQYAQKRGLTINLINNQNLI